MNPYSDLGVEPILNVSGAVTRLGGAPMPAAVVAAMSAAAAASVPLDALHGAAGRVIADLTGAEAGLVVGGAAAGLLLGAAAILAGDDPARMDRLPDTAGLANEFVVAREHRNGYDHAVRAVGARLVEVGLNEVVAGAGVRRAEAWEYAAAFGPRTAGVLYVYGHGSAPPFAEVVAVAHAAGLPVLVDAAGELPPRANLRSIIAAGADLVAFSGGKAVRGPQGTGILCGRRALIGSAAVQMLDLDDHFELWDPPPELIDKARYRGLPRHGIGRTVKVAKEQIVGLVTALRLFAAGAYDADLPAMRRHLDAVAAALADRPVRCRLVVPADGESIPILELALDEAALGRSTVEVCRRLRAGRPPVYVGHGGVYEGTLTINPLHMTADRTTALIARLHVELTPGG